MIIILLYFLQESPKEKGKQIGHKGLGFKSVFVCSDEPIIVSKEWRFQFIKRPTDDELAYITPYYVNESEYPDSLTELINSNKSCNTFIYLPFKESYTKLKSVDEIASLIDKHILLFTNNIEKIQVEDRVNQTTTEIKCKKQLTNSTEQAELFSSKFDSIQKWNCVVSVDKHLKSLDKYVTEKSSIYSYECRITLPDDYVKEENMKTNKTCLTFSFPAEINCQKTYPVFAFLPVYDIGFRFILNSYWSLTTSRESIYL